MFLSRVVLIKLLWVNYEWTVLTFIFSHSETWRRPVCTAMNVSDFVARTIGNSCCSVLNIATASCRNNLVVITLDTQHFTPFVSYPEQRYSHKMLEHISNWFNWILNCDGIIVFYSRIGSWHLSLTPGLYSCVRLRWHVFVKHDSLLWIFWHRKVACW